MDFNVSENQGLGEAGRGLGEKAKRAAKPSTSSQTVLREFILLKVTFLYLISIPYLCFSQKNLLTAAEVNIKFVSQECYEHGIGPFVPKLIFIFQYI